MIVGTGGAQILSLVPGLRVVQPLAGGGFGGEYYAMSAGRTSTFNVATVNSAAKGFTGAGYDGRYLYLVPNYNGSHHGTVARLDTQATFGDAGSWSTFNVATVNSAAKGFYGAGYDGRYLYLVPFNNGSYHGTVARLDTKSAAYMPPRYSGSWL